MIKLTWDDLFIQDPAIDFRSILACWPEDRGNILPIGLLPFGVARAMPLDAIAWHTISRQALGMALTPAQPEEGKSG